MRKKFTVFTTENYQVHERLSYPFGPRKTGETLHVLLLWAQAMGKVHVKFLTIRLTRILSHRILRKMKITAFRSCVFCGLTADSREHVFAKRLCARAGAKNIW
jgi:hypothetical protein